MSLTLHLEHGEVFVTSDTSTGRVRGVTLYRADGSIVAEGSVTMDVTGEFALVGDDCVILGRYDMTCTWWMAREDMPHAALLRLSGSAPFLLAEGEWVVMSWHPERARLDVQAVATHVLKVQDPYFDALDSGDKTFEVRFNDRCYQRGDTLHLRQWDTGSATQQAGWTGRECTRYVTYVYGGDPRFGGVEPGFVVLGLAVPDPYRQPEP